MKNHLTQVNKDLKRLRTQILKDSCLKEDLDLNLDFIPPFSNATDPDKVKLIFIGQDPTIRNVASRKNIKTTLNLDKSNSLKTYLSKVCNELNVDLETEVYATNLYKCFFHIPPADDETILNRHFKLWCDFLLKEIKPFENPVIITLGEPVLKQLIHTGKKEVKHYWDYSGSTQSGLEFKYSKPNENYLQRRIFPLAHQPTWSRNKFYRAYLDAYLKYILAEK